MKLAQYQIDEIADRDRELEDGGFSEEDMQHVEIDRRNLLAHISAVEAERDKLRGALDQAWEAINLLGAPDTAVGPDAFELGYCQAIKDAMAEIEKLGGKNPATRP